MCCLSRFYSPFKLYKRKITLKGPRDAVLSLSFSPTGRFVLAAGYSGAVIWELNTSASVASPYITSDDGRPTVFTASTWVFVQGTNRHVAILGTMEGDVLCWEWRDDRRGFEPFMKLTRPHDRSQVLSIDVRHSMVKEDRLARITMSTANGLVSVWHLDPESREFAQVFCVDMGEGFLPKTVCFGNKKKRDVLVFSFTGAKIRQLHHNSGDVRSEHQISADVLGTTCVNEKNDRFVCWTGKNFQLFRLSDLEHIRTFDGGVPLSVNLPKRVVFLDGGNMIAVGSDHGHAVVYDTANAKPVQKLGYSREGLVQQLAVCCCVLPDFELVAIAGGAMQQDADVVIFRRRREKPPPSLNDPVGRRTNFMQWIPKLRFSVLLLYITIFSLCLYALVHLSITAIPTALSVWQLVIFFSIISSFCL
ncbi:hypothetical protein K435DRAFT_688530 [Dendrothele bispora CBS 962.96]|uniref:WD40 repeat-like protein n=1 Tax=Dendrothele bispora (strain CBS 962.96) TaxID=1314807 RepID=A0A4S8L6D6_DENBC|nr:hypothetical protein K435DRAFT_688530 [Dendrothele bispora CBS 962.96]